jgi:hypothetical protein
MGMEIIKMTIFDEDEKIFSEICEHRKLERFATACIYNVYVCRSCGKFIEIPIDILYKVEE